MTTNTVILPETEAFTPEDTLTDEQRKAIDDFKDEDWNLEVADEEKKESKKEEAKTPEKEPEKEAEEEEETAEEKAKRSEEEKESKKEAEEEAKEVKRLEDKAKKLEKSVEEVEQVEADEKAEQERIDKVAKEEGLTADEVKENEEKDKSIAERHGSDPIKLARALRKEQSEYGKANSEVEELREYKNKSEQARTANYDKQFNAAMEEKRDEIIDKYREKYAEESEYASDDTLFERGKTLIRKGLEEKQKAQLAEIKTTASDKRKSLITELPEEYKDYVPEIKTMLDDLNDRQVLDKEFDIKYLATFARGQKFTPDYLKALEDTAYKRGSEKAKIMPRHPGGKPSGSKGDAGIIAKMTTADKHRAEEMYGRRDGWSKDKMYSTYMKDDKNDDF